MLEAYQTGKQAKKAEDNDCRSSRRHCRAVIARGSSL